MGQWAYLAESFLAASCRMSSLLVRYEDLVKDSFNLDDVDSYAGVSIDRGVLEQRVGSRKAARIRINPWERAICALLTTPLLRRLGYTLSGGVNTLVDRNAPIGTSTAVQVSR